MTQIGAPRHDPIDIGTEASPPFAVLPEPDTLFVRRAGRFAALAEGHALGGYLSFAGRVCALQAAACAKVPAPASPAPDALKLARDGAMPPLPLTGLAADPAFTAVLHHLIDAIRDDDQMPAPARAAAERFTGYDALALERVIDALIVDAVPADSIAEHVIVGAALQVRMARAAAQLDVASLQPIADGVCPACGSVPVASSVVGRPGAQNARYCTCSVCATEWNVVRVKCVSCGSTGGITYLSLAADGEAVGGQGGIESGSERATAGGKRESKLDRELREARDAVKGETCDGCKGYLKILYQVKDHAQEPVADDTASLGLDLKLAEQGWQRKGRNLFLLGVGLPSSSAASGAQAGDAAAAEQTGSGGGAKPS